MSKAKRGHFGHIVGCHCERCLDAELTKVRALLKALASRDVVLTFGNRGAST
jgi:hypothetical protein